MLSQIAIDWRLGRWLLIGTWKNALVDKWICPIDTPAPPALPPFTLSDPSRTLVIGEVGLAHDGSLGFAHAFIDAIADCGADGVKFQTHIASAESTLAEPWRVKFSRQDDSRYDYWQRTEFTPAQWLGLREHAHQRGLWFLSSPFSNEAVELLNDIGIDGWKIASGELNNLPMLRRIAELGQPVLLSSGMSDWEELDAAVELFRESEVAVLQCTSAYPCPPERIGLNLIDQLRDRYQTPTGLSDHSGTIFPSLAAATLAASVLEVHVAMSRRMFGPDVKASVTCEELEQLVRGVRFINQAIRNPVDKDSDSQQSSDLRRLFCKSLVARTDLAAGTVLTAEHLSLKKPGTGLPAARMDDLIGRRLRRDLHADELLAGDDLSPLESV